MPSSRVLWAYDNQARAPSEDDGRGSFSQRWEHGQGLRYAAPHHPLTRLNKNAAPSVRNVQAKNASFRPQQHAQYRLPGFNYHVNDAPLNIPSGDLSYAGYQSTSWQSPSEERSLRATRKLLFHARSSTHAPILHGPREMKERVARRLKRHFKEGDVFLEYFSMDNGGADDDNNSKGCESVASSSGSMTMDIKGETVNQLITENLRRSSTSPPPTPTAAGKNSGRTTRFAAVNHDDDAHHQQQQQHLQQQHLQQQQGSLISDDRTLSSTVLDEVEEQGEGLAWIPAGGMPHRENGKFGTYPVVLRRNDGLVQRPCGVLNAAEPLGLALLAPPPRHHPKLLLKDTAAASASAAMTTGDRQRDGSYFFSNDSNNHMQQWSSSSLVSSRRNKAATMESSSVERHRQLAFDEISAGLSGRRRSIENLRTKKLGDGHAQRRHHRQQRLEQRRRLLQQRDLRRLKSDGRAPGSASSAATADRLMYGPSVTELQRRRFEGEHQRRTIDVHVRGSSPAAVAASSYAARAKAVTPTTVDMGNEGLTEWEVVEDPRGVRSSADDDATTGSGDGAFSDI